MQNVRLDEAQDGIKIARRNINNLRYTDDTTLMAESEEELKEPLDEGERGEWKDWLKTQHSKTKIMAYDPITSWKIDGEQWKQWQTNLTYMRLSKLWELALGREAWHAAAHGIAKRCTQLSNWTELKLFLQDEWNLHEKLVGDKARDTVKG